MIDKRKTCQSPRLNKGHSTHQSKTIPGHYLDMTLESAKCYRSILKEGGDDHPTLCGTVRKIGRVKQQNRHKWA